LNDEPVDITNKDSSGARTLLAGAGVNSITVTGSGVFLDSPSEATLRTAMGASDFHNFEVIIPDFGAYQGEFMLATLSYSGEYNGETNYDFTLESSGTIAYTAA
jgi:TP901-1 family phage major tail protein